MLINLKRLSLKSNKALIKLNYINNKKNDNFFEIKYDNKTSLLIKNKNFWKVK